MEYSEEEPALQCRRQLRAGLVVIEAWIRGCPDGRTKTFGRTPGLLRYKIEDSVPCPDGTFLGVEGKLGDTIQRSPPIVTDFV